MQNLYTTLSCLQCRLSCQLVREQGILFFVLPRRCIDSAHVGGIKHFTSLLNGLGLFELLPHRETPKLFLFVLGNAENETAAAAAQASRVSEHATSTAGQSSAKRRKKSSVEVPSTVAGTDTTPEDAWKVQARAQIDRYMAFGTYKHFSRDFSTVPANQFAVALPADLIAGVFKSE
jgi:hypothetical protein